MMITCDISCILYVFCTGNKKNHNKICKLINVQVHIVHQNVLTQFFFINIINNRKLT